MADMADDPLLYPPKEPPAFAVKIIDILSWALPAIAAALSIWGGIEALNHADNYAAGLGIVAGIVSALGVIFTNWASRIRDNRLKVAHALGERGFQWGAQAIARDGGSF